MVRRGWISVALILCTSLCAGARAQDDTLDSVKAQIAERLATLNTYSADTQTRMNLGSIGFLIRGNVRGKGEMAESSATFDIFGQKIANRVIVDAAGVHWREMDALGEKAVSKSKKAHESTAVEYGFGTMIGAEKMEPRTILEALSTNYNLAALGRKTLDGAQVFVIGGSMADEELKQTIEEFKSSSDADIFGGFLEGIVNSFSQVRTYIGVNDGFPRKLEFLTTEGKPTLTLTFTNLKFNEPIDDSVFAYTPPDGVPVEDLDLVTKTATVQLGEPAPNFEALALDGSTVKLADYKGKVVLLDFWAIWCTPCVEQLPGLIAFYEEFHPQGLEVIGVSLDGDRAKVESFLKDNAKVVWPQIFDGNAWESEVAELYGIEVLPFTVLIGKNGNILALDAHGEDLEKAVAAALAAD